MNWGITCFFEEKKDFEIVTKLAPHYPLKYIEIRGERPFFSPDDLSNKDLDFFREVIQSTNLKVTLHATFYDINLATFNSSIRTAVLNCYRTYLDLGESVGAEIMVVHGGFLHRDASKIDKLYQMAKQNLIENLEELGNYAKKKGIKIGLENSPPNPNQLMVYNWKNQVEILQAVNQTNVGAVLDLAHAYLHQIDLFDYYKNINPYLLELHVHNNDGESDQHLSITQGKINFQHFFSMNEIYVPIILEIRTVEEALDTLEWIKMFENQKQL